MDNRLIKLKEKKTSKKNPDMFSYMRLFWFSYLFIWELKEWTGNPLGHEIGSMIALVKWNWLVILSIRSRYFVSKRFLIRKLHISSHYGLSFVESRCFTETNFYWSTFRLLTMYRKWYYRWMRRGGLLPPNLYEPCINMGSACKGLINFNGFALIPILFH